MDKQPTRVWLKPAALVLLTLLAYLPAMRAGWIWDDDYYVTQNVNLRSAAGLKDLWLKLGAVPQYYPVTHTTFWVEYQLWRLNPVGYHIDNILLHALAAVLLYRLLSKLNVPGAWLAAAVWAVHPVNVESVAWVTERKNVLSAVFYLAAFLAYLRFDERSREGPREAGGDLKPRWGWYALAIALFVLALLSKSVTTSLPAAILLVAWWKRGRITRREIALTVPMFILGIAMSLLTAYMERTYVGATGYAFELTRMQRILIAGRAVWFYAWKLIWPARLSFIYPKWVIDPRMAVQWVFPIWVFLALLVLWLTRKRLGRGPIVALLFFGGTLVPALGFVNVLPMRYSYVADHFQYLASIGVIVLIVGALSQLVPRGGMRAVGAVIILALGITTAVRQSAFMDARTLWVDTLAKNPLGSMPNNNYGNLLLADGKLDQAERHFRTAITSDPHNVEAITNLGVLFEKQGSVGDAMTQYRQAIVLEPRYSIALTNAGRLLGIQYELDDALRYLSAAITANPRYVPAWRAMGMVYENKKELPRAIAALRQGVQVNPTDSDLRVDLSRLLARTGDLRNATVEAAEAVRLDPENAAAHNQLGMVLEAQGEASAAEVEYRRALQLRPEFPQAQRNLRRLTETKAMP